VTVSITRRELFDRAAGLALGTAITVSPAGFCLVDRAHAQAPSNEELMQAGPLGEAAQGSAEAPVTIIEYASMTCTHCAHFAATTYPELKSRYIDTGKVRFMLREFPLDPLAEAGFMLARCAGPDKYFAVVDMLFEHQSDWVVRQPLEPLLALAKQAGFTKESFEACLSNQQVLDGIKAVRDRAAEKFAVNSTPTFFINGVIHRGDLPIDQLEKMIESYFKT
jgi:protein-disulfide isomerase